MCAQISMSFVRVWTGMSVFAMGAVEQDEEGCESDRAEGNADADTGL